MELPVLWSLASILVVNALQVYGSLPVPVIHFEDKIIEEEDTKITCTLPYNDLPDVELVIKANISLTDCTPRRGNFPNVTCSVEVTQEMHEMEFICEAEFKTQSLPKKLNIQTSPEFTDCPKNLVWIEGEENSFHCKAKGYPLPNVTCSKNNTSYKDGEKFTVMRNMSGEYTCTALNFDVDKQKVLVSVEYKPKILGINVSPALHAEGSNVMITCEANGHPDPVYSWIMPSSEIQLSSDNRTVTISSLKSSHLGNYQCQVQNKLGRDTREETLTLAVKPTIINFKIQPSAQVIEGENVTMTCEATGYPPPVFKWSPPAPDVELSQDRQTLKIWGVKNKHVGAYDCTAENKYGTDTKSQQLSLGEKPSIVKIIVQPSSSVSEGSNLTLTCVGKGVPVPTYSWIKPTGDVHFSTDKKVITISSAKKVHGGDYTCKAENKYGSAQTTTTVTVTESIGGRAERKRPVTTTSMAMLITTLFYYYYL